MEDIIFGSVEVREKSNNKYIYIHFRENGILRTKYLGEYSLELHNLILSNNVKIKEYKKEFKVIQNRLNSLNYIDDELSEKIKLNIDYARKNLVNSIYKQSILEGIATTYADIERLIDGAKVSDMNAVDMLKIINLKHAWDFILNKNVILSNTDFNLCCEINKCVEEGFSYMAGKLRSVPVEIAGTKWKSVLPIEGDIKDDFNVILDNEIDIYQNAIDIMLYIMKKQMFLDGNKRTAVILANHLLIKHGVGIMIVPDEKTEEFKKLLILYYENDDKEKISLFLKENAISKIFLQSFCLGITPYRKLLR